MTLRREIHRLRSQLAAGEVAAAPCTTCGLGVPPGPGELPAVRVLLIHREGEPEPEPTACRDCGRVPPDDEICVIHERIVTTRLEAMGDSPPPATGGPAGAMAPGEALTDFDLPDEPAP